jgi:hypothetical protein
MEVIVYLDNIVMVMGMKLGFVTSIPYHTNLDLSIAILCMILVFKVASGGGK